MRPIRLITARFIPLITMALVTMALVLAPGWPASRYSGLVQPAFGQAVVRKRLILKDGTWQIVTKWQVKGNRVRYYSAEREEWEEVPNDLVDWPATEKWNKDHGPGAPPDAADQEVTPTVQTPEQQQKEAAEIDREAAAEKADQQARTPLVAPGLRLPDRSGIFVLDNFQSIPELIHLDQSAGDVNRDINHNVLRAAIASFHGAQEPVRLYGQAARVRLHINDPVLYVSLDTTDEQIAPESAVVVNTHGASSVPNKDDHSSPDSRYAIVKVDVQPGERVIGALRISRAGTATQSADIVPMKAEILPGKHWMRLTPKDPLPIGEYALMEILSPGVVNLDVWAFGVSPGAPENAHPITPIKNE
ncbi:MAG TPA: hypothetical protein VHZ09_01215 [Acidobacteriaceae bacterium]|nr:hypothetical protein [Acidobacteriaceae bacterium]